MRQLISKWFTNGRTQPELARWTLTFYWRYLTANRVNRPAAHNEDVPPTRIIKRSRLSNRNIQLLRFIVNRWWNPTMKFLVRSFLVGCTIFHHKSPLLRQGFLIHLKQLVFLRKGFSVAITSENSLRRKRSDRLVSPLPVLSFWNFYSILNILSTKETVCRSSSRPRQTTENWQSIWNITINITTHINSWVSE